MMLNIIVYNGSMGYQSVVDIREKSQCSLSPSLRQAAGLTGIAGIAGLLTYNCEGYLLMCP